MRERGGGAPPMSSSRGGARAERLPEGAASLRSQLFGASLAGGPSAPLQHAGASGMQQALEEDNNRLTDDLQAKVTALRFASQSIHDEVSEHNRMLGGMSGDFDRTGSLLSGTLLRLDGLLRQGRQGHMCYLVGFTRAF